MGDGRNARCHRLGGLTFVFVSCLLALLAQESRARADWEMTLTVTAGHTQCQVAFGEAADATSGFDGTHDVPAFLSGDLQVFLSSQTDAEGKMANARKVKDGKKKSKQWRDIREVSARGYHEWGVWVETASPGASVTLAWDGAALPAGWNLRLIDGQSGEAVDFRAASSYTFSVEAPRLLRITAQRVNPAE